MASTFVDVNGIPTRIRTWGQSVNEPFKKKEVILFVCGNPGITGFYITFLATLYQCLQGQMPIWAIGHGGHDEPEDESLQMPPLESNEHLYDLNGQVKQKVEFIRKYIPSDVKIHLVGHSIGAYTSVQLLKFEEISQRIHHCYLLFPTLEHMIDAPNGKTYVMCVQKPFRIIYQLLKFLSYVPVFAREMIIRVVCWIRSFPQEFVPWILMFVRPSVFTKIVYMSDDEMEKVKDADDAILNDNKHRLTFIYSTTDGWAPATHYERLMTQIPDAKAQLSDKFSHSFVIRSACEMATLLGEWIEQNPL